MFDRTLTQHYRQAPAPRPVFLARPLTTVAKRGIPFPVWLVLAAAAGAAIVAVAAWVVS